VLRAEELGKRVAIISMLVSGSLAIAKLVIGFLAGSTSVVADGVESAADVLASGFILVGFHVAARPPDDNHPYGHGRFETLTGLGVGLALAFTGVMITWRSLNGIGEAHAPPATYALWPLVASILAKGALATYKFRQGARIGSLALRADAWNDTVDILSGSVAFAAVTLTIYDPARFLSADHYGGAAVGLIVIVLGWQVVRETSMTLMDTMPDEDTLRRIRESAMRVEGARFIEKCYARRTGLRYHVDLHVEVDPNLSVRDGHSIAEQVRNRVKADLDCVADVLVHIEPLGGSTAPPR
jgi:cation diffusion facilitator family transporter